MSKKEIEFDELYPLPEDWQWSPFEDLMVTPKQDIVDGPFGSNLKASEYTDAGVPIARLQNIDRNQFVYKNIKFVSEDKAEYLDRHNFRPGDILITKLGYPLGEACIAPEKISHGIIVADLVRVRVPVDGIDRKYLTYAINSPFLVRQFEKHTKGTTRPRVNLGIIRKLPIPVAPLEQQKRIVAEIEKQFSRLDEAVANLKRVKANLKRYKAAVLKAAVEGKLTEEWRKQHLPAPTSVPGKFYTYAILCDDDSIYIGHTDDIERRWKEHRHGQGAVWTQKHKPVKIAHYEEHDSRDEAAEREKWLKTGYGRKWLKREIEAGRTRQAGDVEPADKLLERILAERREKWQGRGQYKEPAAPDTTDLPELPEGWVWTSIGQAFEVCIGATPSRGKSEYWNGTIPWVSSGEVAFCRIRSTRETITDLGLKNTSTALHRPGTILLGMIGEGKTRGQVAILDIEACNNQNSAAIRVADTEVLPQYVYSFLECEYESTRKRGSGGNQPALNKSRVGQIVFPLPPIAEQRQIVVEVERCLSIVDGVNAQLDTNLLRADRVRRSILMKAFSGRLLDISSNVAMFTLEQS